MGPGQIGTRTNGPQTNGPRTNGHRDKSVPGQMFPLTNRPRDKWAPGHMGSEQMFPGQMSHGQMDPRTNGPQDKQAAYNWAEQISSEQVYCFILLFDNRCKKCYI